MGWLSIQRQLQFAKIDLFVPYINQRRRHTFRNKSWGRGFGGKQASSKFCLKNNFKGFFLPSLLTQFLLSLSLFLYWICFFQGILLLSLLMLYLCWSGNWLRLNLGFVDGGWLRCFFLCFWCRRHRLRVNRSLITCLSCCWLGTLELGRVRFFCDSLLIHLRNFLQLLVWLWFLLL